MIVKVQIPLASSEPEPMALVYNEDRSVEMRIPIDIGLEVWMEGRAKAFFEAEIEEIADGDRTIRTVEFLDDVEDPGW